MDRVQILISKNHSRKIKNAKILIVGVGGVGSNVAVSLARNGFKNFVLVDFDKVEQSNFNRHVIGLKQYLNQFKCYAMKDFLHEIYDDINVNCIVDKFCFANKNSILNEDYDFVVDAIDKLSDKIELILQCVKKNLKVISAMGASGKMDPSNIKISDIGEAYGDRLLKRVKKNLKKHNIEKGFPVVYCTEETKYIKYEDDKVIGSCAHIPAIFGHLISGYIFNSFLK
jgi:tRNA A37 threonylcarbamoyladenosine dehydratase